jgi:hypothetical protein
MIARIQRRSVGEQLNDLPEIPAGPSKEIVGKGSRDYGFNFGSIAL